MKRRVAVALGLGSLLGACEPAPTAEVTPALQGSAPSPNASIRPAPLASAADMLTERPARPSTSSAVGIPVDSAGRLVVPVPVLPPPEPIHVSEALERDRLDPKDGGLGLSLKVQWRWHDVPDRPSIPEAAPKAIEAANDRIVPAMTVDLSFAGRMRVALESPIFPLPPNAEIRSRADRYGHVLVWPSGLGYRLLAPGSLRALFAERRPDVTALVRAKAKPKGEGKLHGFATKRVALDNDMGSLALEQASVPGSGRAGPLLCRFFSELLTVDPAVEACAEDMVPLRAEFQWASGGRIDAEVTAVEHRQDIPLSFVLVPPAGAAFKPGELPPEASGVFHDLATLAGFRQRPAKLTAPPGRGAPGEGLVAVNHTSTLRYLLIDGVAVAFVPPRGERYVIGPKAGRYGIAWRDFFGTVVTPPVTLELPARLEIGTPPDAPRTAEGG